MGDSSCRSRISFKADLGTMYVQLRSGLMSSLAGLLWGNTGRHSDVSKLLPSRRGDLFLARPLGFLGADR